MSNRFKDVEISKIENALNLGYELEDEQKADLYIYQCPDCNNEIIQKMSDPYWLHNILCRNCYEEMDIVNK